MEDFERPASSGHRIVLLFLAALYLAYKVVTYLRLRKFRGPPLTGLTDLPHSRAMFHGECHKWYAEANQKYG